MRNPPRPPVDSLPIFLRIAGESCLVAGGGAPAASKVDLLLRAGAAVTVITPAPGAALESLASRGRIELLTRECRPSDLVGRRLAFVATGCEHRDRAVAAAAKVHRVPVNVVDRPGLCAFTMPAIVDRSPVVVAVSTAGASPALARHVRAELEALLPATLGRLATFAAALRDAVRARLASAHERRAFWAWMMEGPVAELVHRGEQGKARAMAEAALADPSRWGEPGGEVFFLDAGARNPDRCTLGALRAAQRADVVVHDANAPLAWLDLARRDACRVCVEDAGAGRSTGATAVEDALIAHARAGRKVLRLRTGCLPDEVRWRAEQQAVAARDIPTRVLS